jgi:superfamily II RNA helicase
VNRECDQIIRKLPNYEEYMRLPEYISLVRLLEKGIGIHHSGMIPVLREIVELLISKKYIKLLFATESFAIGLDCPIKTAVFTGLTKFDGTNERYLLSHEYTQMAGRAGRRGIDTIGHVVHCNNLFPLPTQTEYKAMMGGKPQELVSKFRVSYSLVLQNQDVELSLEFANRSMIYGEIQSVILSQKKQIEELEQKLVQKLEGGMKWSKTPVDICKRLLEIEKELPRAINKKKKDLQKEQREITDCYRTWESDVRTYKEIDLMENTLYREKMCVTERENYLTNQISAIKKIIEKRGFDMGEPMAKIAASISEVHPMIWAESVVLRWNYFEQFSERQLVGLFSCITDVKVSQEHRIQHPKTDDVDLKKRLEELADLHLLYERLEYEYGVQNTGFHYQDALNYNIIDESMEWCDCKSEEECKWFIQTRLNDKEISVGDFTKAMLKISTFAKELSSLENSVIMGKTDMFYKLSQIDGMILKYVATAQSLYV